MDLDTVRQELVDPIKEILGQVASGHPVARLSAEFERASRLFQGLALCDLLTNLDVEGFRTNLLRSVHARVYFLRKSREQGNKADRRLALSRTEALFDVLAAGHDGLRDQLVAQSAFAFNPDWEYEDDHLAQRWMQQLAAGADDATLQATQRQHRLAMRLPIDARHRALAALTDRDAPAFDEALLALMQAQDAAAQARQARLLEPDLDAFLHWPRCFVSVEGLALLALAARRGVTAPGPYPLCPDAARLPPNNADTENFFSGIEQLLAPPPRP